MFRLVLALIGLLSVANAGSPEQWKGRTIYQLLTDRFANPSSNSPCDNLSDYCGGTFQGVIKNLDYITGMGFDAIWISPVVENTKGGYHGYWALDIYEINHFFGTSKDLKALSDACHEKGVWLMIDVVANHMGNLGYDYSSAVPFSAAEHYHGCNTCPSNSDGGCSISDFNDQQQVQICRLDMLPDLDQSNPFVEDTLVDWVHSLVSNYSADGIRIDTVPEVNQPFWGKFQQSAGVYAVGEVFNGNPAYGGPYQNYIDGILDYPMFYTMRNIWQSGQSMSQIDTRISQLQSNFKDWTLLGQFLDNHDNQRFLYSQPDQQQFMSALGFMLTSTGIPIVYYGSEQGFKGPGNGNDPNNRQPLWTSGYDRSAPIYKFLSTIIKARKAFKIWDEEQTRTYVDDSFYAFTRGQFLVCLTNTGSNGGTTKRSLTYYPSIPDGTKLCNIFYPTSDCIVANSKTGAEVYLVNGQVKVYVPENAALKLFNTTSTE